MVVVDSKLVVLVPKALRKRVFAKAKEDRMSVSKVARDALASYLGTEDSDVVGTEQ